MLKRSENIALTLVAIFLLSPLLLFLFPQKSLGARFLSERVMGNHPNDTSPMLAPCNRTGSEGQMSFSGKIILNKLFFSEGGPSKQEIRSAVKSQIRFVSGFTNAQENKTNFKFITVFDDPEIEIQHIQDRSYGIEMAVDRIQGDEFDSPDYVKKAIQRGFTKAEDAALEVTYKAQIRVAFCAPSLKVSHEDIPLPYDPYLALWMTPANQRRPTKYHSVISTTTPCADPEMADLMAPKFYWYTWQPENSGKDLNSKNFDCHEILKEGTHYEKVNAILLSEKANSKPYNWGKMFTKYPSSLSASFIFGTLLPRAFKLNIEEMRSKLTVSNDISKNAEDFYKELVVNPYSRDPGVFVVLQFLSNLSKTFVLKNQVVNSNQHHISMVLSGELKESKVPMKLNIYFGMIADEPNLVSDHWSYLWKGLKSDEILFYTGHAGMGENLNFDTMKSHLKLSNSEFKNGISTVANQFIALISCYGYSYYSGEFLKSRSLSQHLKTEIMTTGAATNPHWLSSTYLKYLDDLFAGQHPVLYNSMASNLSRRDFLIFRSSN